MRVQSRPHHVGFLEDVKKILGDKDGVVSPRPSQAQNLEYLVLCANLWGEIRGGKRVIPELESDLKDHLRTEADQLYEIRYAPWGAESLELMPWPSKFVQKYRIWFVRENDGTERLMAMTDVKTITDRGFQDFDEVVGPRILEAYPSSRIERQEPKDG
jgi:hypothetical protein